MSQKDLAAKYAKELGEKQLRIYELETEAADARADEQARRNSVCKSFVDSQEYTTLLTDIESQAKKIAELQTALEAQRKESETHMRRVHEKQARITHLENTTTELEDEVGTHKKRILEYESKLCDHTVEYERITAELRSELQTKSDRVSDLDAKLESQGREKERAVSPLKADLASKTECYSELSAYLEAERVNHEQKVSDLEAQREAGATRARDLAAEFEALRQDGEYKIRDLGAQLEAKNERLQDLSALVTAEQGKVETAHVRIADLLDQLKDADREHSAPAQPAQPYLAPHAIVGLSSQEPYVTITNLDSTMAGLRKAAEKDKQKICELRKKVEALRAESHTTSENKAKRLEAQVQTLQKTLQTRTDDLVSCENDLKNSEKDLQHSYEATELWQEHAEHAEMVKTVGFDPLGTVIRGLAGEKLAMVRSLEAIGTGSGSGETGVRLNEAIERESKRMLEVENILGGKWEGWKKRSTDAAGMEDSYIVKPKKTRSSLSRKDAMLCGQQALDCEDDEELAPPPSVKSKVSPYPRKE